MTERLAGGGTGVGTNGGGEDLATRLARAEERLAFFASFDRLIQDNVSQAGQLMRDALELRERTQAELAEAREQAEARVGAERERYRGDLAAVHAELVSLQASTAAMARRVAATLGELAAGDLAITGIAGTASAVGPGLAALASPTGGVESDSGAWPAPAGIETVEPAQSDAAAEAGAAATDAEESTDAGRSPSAPLPADGGAGGDGEADRGDDAAALAAVAAGGVVGEADEGEAAGAVIAAGAEADAGPHRGGGGAGPPADDAVGAEMAALGMGTADAAGTGGDGAREEGRPQHGAAGFPGAGGGEADTDGAPGAPLAAAAPAAARAVMVLVHGVPRAAAALSLQRHLHGLRHVESVEAREYAEGVLRLQVTTGEALGLDDLRGWDGGAGLEPVTVTADVIEVRLPGAHGF